MSRIVKIATIQPPAVDKNTTPDSIMNHGINLFKEAAGHADIVCMPEFLNCMGSPVDTYSKRCSESAIKLIDVISKEAAKNNCYAIVPVVIDIESQRFNRAFLIDRQGNVTGYFDKVHLPEPEITNLGITAGNEWPVFDCDFGKIGIMICYDGCFPESSRILALKGAEIIFWPSLQRSYTERELLIQTQAHAYFNYTNIVRSSYGTDKSSPWQPGKMIGMSCVCGADGNILASLGRWCGWTVASVDLDGVQVGARTFGGDIGVIKEMRLSDRRPETYQYIKI